MELRVFLLLLILEGAAEKESQFVMVLKSILNIFLINLNVFFIIA
jgi:hypothetical protein